MFPADPDRYAARARKPAPLAALVHDTFPNLAEVWSDRLALEERVRHAASRLSAEERSALIREPFLLLSPHVASRYARRHIDKEAALALVAAVILLAMTPTIASTFAPDEEFPLTVAAIVVGGGLVIWQMGKTGRRFLLREVVPTLGLALAPLRPSHAEVGGVLAELARHGHKIGTELKAADVVPPRAALPP